FVVAKTAFDVAVNPIGKRAKEFQLRINNFLMLYERKERAHEANLEQIKVLEQEISELEERLKRRNSNSESARRQKRPRIDATPNKPVISEKAAGKRKGYSVATNVLFSDDI
ncbi:hypothetical protein FA95DRAFT_1578535, partial [Auriscalpium vulgare]